MTTDGELAKQLATQLRLLDKRIQDFDEGDDAEALPISSLIRTFVHDTKNSRSLLKQLGVKDGMPMKNTAILLRDVSDKDQPSRSPSGVGMELGIVDIAHYTSGPVAFVAQVRTNAKGLPLQFAPFEEWWKGVVIIDGRRQEFTRRGLVLAVAHKDGGAHVDLDDRGAPYLGLSQFGSLGWAHEAGGATLGNPNVPVATDSPVPAAIRQIAEELRDSVREHLQGRFDLPQQPEPVPIRTAAFYTGSVFMSAPGPGWNVLLGGNE